MPTTTTTTTGEDVPTTTTTTTGEDVPTTTTTARTLTATDTAASAADSIAAASAADSIAAASAADSIAAAIAARRARRADTAAEMTARDDMARMTARMGDDVIGASVVATYQRAAAMRVTALLMTGRIITDAAIGAVIGAAWVNARQSRYNANRATAADANRVDIATGRSFTTCTWCRGTDDDCTWCRGTGHESAAMRAARVAAQHADMAAATCQRVLSADDVAAIESADATFRNMTRRAWAMRDAVAVKVMTVAACTTSTTVAAWAMPALTDDLPMTARTTCRLCAVVAAMTNDGPITKPDHDAATCAVLACRKCAGIRARRAATDAAANCLTREPRKGSSERRRARRADRAPREKTGRGVIAGKRGKSYGDRVALLKENDVAHLSDRVAHHHADAAEHFESCEPRAWASDSALTAAVFAIVPTAGRRGVRVAWDEWADGHAARTGQTVAWAAWRAGITAHVGAWAIAANYFTADDMPRMARAAGMSTVDLAAAITDHADAANHDAAHAARMSHRADMRTVLASRPAAMAHADAMARDHAAAIAERDARPADWSTWSPRPRCQCGCGGTGRTHFGGASAAVDAAIAAAREDLAADLAAWVGHVTR